MEENFGGEFGVFIELTEVCFVIVLSLSSVFLRQRGWWSNKTGSIPTDLC